MIRVGVTFRNSTCFLCYDCLPGCNDEAASKQMSSVVLLYSLAVLDFDIVGVDVYASDGVVVLLNLI